jgi:hypothetical protein
MTLPPPPAQQAGMVRVLIIAIALMTAAIVFLLGAIVARILSPSAAERPQAATIDFAAAPVVEVGMPAGARVVETHVSADRATFVIEGVEGGRAVYTTPLAGFDEPVRIVFMGME